MKTTIDLDEAKLKRVMNLLGKAGIKVVLATPTGSGSPSTRR